ncbi:MAG: M42 family metallopeptidase [Clostridiales bacterium]
MFDTIAKLTKVSGVSGNEEKIRNLIIDEAKEYVDNVIIDNIGNLTLVKKGTGKKIMLSAHMDEIGLMITHIDENGFLRFSSIGGIYKLIALGQRVIINSNIHGTVYFEEKIKSYGDLNISKMFIDIGVNCREEAKKIVKIGDVATFVGEAVMANKNIIAKSLDNRAGCAVLIKLIKENINTDHEIYYTFTVQEELGMRGAKTAAFDLMPDLAVVVDVTSTGDIPECPLMEVSLGKGPAIKIKDSSVICHPIVRDLLKLAAKKNNIPYQYEILEFGGTDTASILLTGGGIVAGAVSIPCRYIHTPSESVNLDDLKNSVRILKNFILEVK